MKDYKMEHVAKNIGEVWVVVADAGHQYNDRGFVAKIREIGVAGGYDDVITDGVVAAVVAGGGGRAFTNFGKMFVAKKDFAELGRVLVEKFGDTMPVGLGEFAGELFVLTHGEDPDARIEHIVEFWSS